jgi:S-adenosylmethionine:tRNA ribosyltransferase-isomerase
MHISDFDYELPEDLIAQEPVEPRDASRLMILNRQTQQIEHRQFRDILDYLYPGDVLVLNDTRVIPARLRGQRADTGGKLEVLLLRQLGDTEWQALVGGKRADPGMAISFKGTHITAVVVDVLQNAERVIRFSQPLDGILDEFGEMPLPPYIHAH